jgi:methylenetetrahydrofolate dehydrogenase (NADP+)/methenyltetrahydrofolate cyclohydrolase
VGRRCPLARISPLNSAAMAGQSSGDILPVDMAQILDGKWVRDEILREWKPRVDALASSRRPPGLAVVLVGNDPASEIYVRNKVKACADMGIHSEKHTPADTITTHELLALIESLNVRDEIDGILVQMPLPPQVDSRRVLLTVRPDKDVDGFHPMNVGNLVANIPGPRPCTPSGIVELLKRYKISIAGKRAVVIGRSDIVGKPMALLLLHENATVTICHSRTRDLAAECRRADILVAAMGRPAFVTGDFISEGATVIDVGINRLNESEKTAIFGDVPARAVIGDVHPVQVERAAGAFTPVPGGVGPLTIAMLMVNTVTAAEQHLA